MSSDPTRDNAATPGEDEPTAVLPVVEATPVPDEEPAPVTGSSGASDKAPDIVASGADIPPSTPLPLGVPAGRLEDEPARRPRVRTVVWGLMLAAVGVGLLAWAGGATIDVQLAIIVLLGAGGLALLVGSLVPGVRRGRR
ncbi:hypothetical protein [Cellulomonas sp. HZM]|uniref:hypothetical protein n=1 Tax=Cellulomonas sp. HZM TaxID=1454010 RepID=UPI0004932009|nr:hypothetical protein [Cellulomonas sp. HZM]